MATPANLVYLVLLAPRESLVGLEIQVRTEKQETLVILVHKDHQVPPEQMECQAAQALMVPLVIQAQLVRKVRRVE